MANGGFAEPAVIRPQYHFRKVGDHTHIWDVAQLVERSKHLPIHQHLLSDISEIDEPYWFAATAGTPTCRSVMDHAAQVQNADLQYPILLCAKGHVMDGMHRVMKALGQGQSTIQARQLIHTPPPDFIDIAADDLPY
jgi:hypothetical protein